MTTEVRIGDTEREAAIAALGEHFTAGRIDKDEYDERTAVAWTARTPGALVPLFADLPEPHDAAPKAGDGASGAPTNTPRSVRSRQPWRGWLHVARVILVPLIVVLAVLSLIPWFVVAVAVWIGWMGLSRCAWGPRRRWHHGTAAYGGRPGRW